MADLTEGTKYDGGKLRYDLVPAELERDIAEVFTYGAGKYAPNNWKKLDPERLYAAARRHLSEERLGELHDEESQLPHLAHAITCLMMYYWIKRYKKPDDVLPPFQIRI